MLASICHPFSSHDAMSPDEHRKFVVGPFLKTTCSYQKQENVDVGNDPGAPKDPMLKKKFIITTIISFFTTIMIIIVKNEIF